MVDQSTTYHTGYQQGIKDGANYNKYYGSYLLGGNGTTYTGTSGSFTFNNLKAGGRYFFTVILVQEGGSFSDGSAIISTPAFSMTGGTLDGDGKNSWQVVHCYNDERTSLSQNSICAINYQSFTATSSTVTINVTPGMTIKGFWAVHLWGTY